MGKQNTCFRRNTPLATEHSLFRIMDIIKYRIQVYCYKSYCSLHTEFKAVIFRILISLLACCALAFVIMLRFTIQAKKNKGYGTNV